MTTKREFKKWKRKQKKQLKKLLKNDYPWDYGYLINLVDYKITQMYEYYNNYYTKFPSAKHDEFIVPSLLTCKELLEKYKSDLSTYHYVEYELLKRLFTIIAENITKWYE